MTSKDNSSSEHALISLIYRHLKENGYKKAASALKKHDPQVKTMTVKVSLGDIFEKWTSEKRESDKHNYLCTSSVPKPAANATHHTSSDKKVKSQTQTAARTTEQISTGSRTEEDSDSDSSLDVEKWKRLALQLSDSDIAKMDIIPKVSTSTAKARKKRTPAQPKKKQDQTIENGKPSPNKSKAKSSSKKSDKIKTPLKPPASSICESDNVKTPPNKAIVAEHNVTSPQSKMVTSLSDQVATPKTDVSDALSEFNKIKIKRKKSLSLSESDSNKTPSKTAKSEKTEDFSEPKLTDGLHKKKKSKADVKVTIPESLETTSSSTYLGVSMQKSECGLDSVELSESNSSECVSLSAETPTQKSKSKKSKKSKEPGDMAMPSEEGQIKGNNETFQKSSKKAKKILFEAIGTEKPSKKIEIQVATSILEPLSSETPSKKSKTKKGLEANHLDSQSKKDVADVTEVEASRNSSSKPDHVKNLSKKSKRKRTDSSGEKETPEWDNSEVANNLGKSSEGQCEESVSAVEENENPEPRKKKKKKKDKEKQKIESDENAEDVPPTPPAEDFPDPLPSIQKKHKKKKHKHRDEETPAMLTPASEEDTPKKKKKSSKKKEQSDV